MSLNVVANYNKTIIAETRGFPTIKFVTKMPYRIQYKNLEIVWLKYKGIRTAQILMDRLKSYNDKTLGFT